MAYAEVSYRTLKHRSHRTLKRRVRHRSVFTDVVVPLQLKGMPCEEAMVQYVEMVASQRRKYGD